MRPLSSLHPVDLADLTDYTRGHKPATLGELCNAAALANRTVRHRTPLTPRGEHALSAAVLGAVRRLLDVEAELATVRMLIASHVAEADAGDDPTPADLLAALDRHRAPLTADELAAARALHAAQAVTW